MLGLIISSGMGTIAMAQSNAEEETLSEIGVKTGLELYNRDKSDYCVMDGMQIRVTVTNVTPEGLYQCAYAWVLCRGRVSRSRWKQKVKKGVEF